MGKRGRSKNVTIYDIAKKMGLSSATISNALNGTNVVNPITRERIFKTAIEMKYEPRGMYYVYAKDVFSRQHLKAAEMIEVLFSKNEVAKLVFTKSKTKRGGFGVRKAAIELNSINPKLSVTEYQEVIKIILGVRNLALEESREIASKTKGVSKEDEMTTIKVGSSVVIKEANKAVIPVKSPTTRRQISASAKS